MFGIQIEINGDPYQGTAYQAGNGILIHLPGVQSPYASAFEALFQPLPGDRLSGGFIEAGEWDGKAFPFEGDLLFGLGPDGAVWAKVCESLQELPVVEAVDEKTSCAWRILAEADEAFELKSTVIERAAGSNRLAPSTIPDYLMLIEEEVDIQQKAAARLPETSQRMILVRALQGIASELRELGFTPASTLCLESEQNGIYR
jgi:hypothetical protein